jgi:hypothetical protein
MLTPLTCPSSLKLWQAPSPTRGESKENALHRRWPLHPSRRAASRRFLGSSPRTGSQDEAERGNAGKTKACAGYSCDACFPTPLGPGFR